MIKICGKCRQEKSVQEFNKRARALDSLQSYCRPCSNTATLTWNKENPLRYKAYNKDWAHINKSKRIRAVRKWQKNNPEIIKAWILKNKEKIADIKKRYRRNHPEKGNEWNSTRRARLLGLFVETVKKSVVWIRDKGICGICQQPADPNDWHLDHIIPLSKGGPHSYANTQVSHSHCNQVKWNKLNFNIGNT